MTPEDWKWRAEFLREAAKNLRQKISQLEDEASNYSDMADQAEQMAIFLVERDEVT